MNLLIPRPDSTRRAELWADLHAVGAPSNHEWTQLPSILRRVATEVAKLVPADARALIGVGPGGTFLAIAVSLETGLPLVSAPSPDVVAVAVLPHPEPLDALSKISVFDEGADPEWRVALTEEEAGVPTKGMTMTTEELTAAITSVTVTDGSLSRIDLGRDPQAARVLARHIATRFAEAGVEAVVSWRFDDDIVLAQMVAEELGLQRFAIADDEGLLSPNRALAAGGSIGWVTVDDAGRLPRAVAEGLVDGAQAKVVAYADLQGVVTG